MFRCTYTEIALDTLLTAAFEIYGVSIRWSNILLLVGLNSSTFVACQCSLQWPILTCIWLVDCQYFFGSEWKSLTGKQKHIVCASLYYASNWIRELVSGSLKYVTFIFQLVCTCKLLFLTPSVWCVAQCLLYTNHWEIWIHKSGYKGGYNCQTFEAFEESYVCYCTLSALNI